MDGDIRGGGHSLQMLFCFFQGVCPDFWHVPAEVCVPMADQPKHHRGGSLRRSHRHTGSSSDVTNTAPPSTFTRYCVHAQFIPVICNIDSLHRVHGAVSISTADRPTKRWTILRILLWQALLYKKPRCTKKCSPGFSYLPRGEQFYQTTNHPFWRAKQNCRSRPGLQSGLAARHLLVLMCIK